MTKAGIDVGTTLTKFAWLEKDGRTQCASSLRTPIPIILGQMKEAGVTAARLTGLRDLPFETPFPVYRLDGNRVETEIETMVKGFRHVIGDDERQRSMYGRRVFPSLCVCIGTGTSLTYVGQERGGYTQLMGLPLGGGFLEGISSYLGFEDLQKFSLHALHGTAPDTLFRDVDPSINPASGDFIVGHMTKLRAATKLEDVCAGFVRVVSVAIFREIKHALEQRDFAMVTLFGSGATTIPSLAMMLIRDLKRFDIKVVEPPFAEFIGAIGAMLD